MFGISGEHLLVLLVILLIFGPKRLPDLGHSIGRTLKNFKDGLNTHTEAQDRAAERERLEAKAPLPPMNGPSSALATTESPVTAAANGSTQDLGQGAVGSDKA
jgi:sec-independent protein translocase protein TatA